MSRARTLPHDDASERNVLGAVLLAGAAAWTQVEPLVRAEDFYHPAHRAIFDAMAAAAGAKQPIDAITVAAQMRAAETPHVLNAVGGEPYLAQLMAEVVAIGTVAHHAAVVARKAERRRWVSVLQEVVATGLAEGSDDEFFTGAESALVELSGRRRAGPVEVRHVKPIAKAMLNSLAERVERARQGKRITGIPVGFEDLDTMLSGLHRGELVVVAARPSMGKTAFALNVVARGADEPGTAVLVFSLEMTAESLVERLVAADGRVNSQRLRNGDLEVLHWTRLHSATARVVERPIWINDRGSMTVAELCSYARRWRVNDAKDFKQVEIVVDYLQLLSGPQRGRDFNRQQEVSEISRHLKLLAKDLDCPVVALSQLSRKVEERGDKRPLMSDLRESGAIEQDADVIAFLYRDEVYSKENCKPEDRGVAEVIVGKQRNGPTGMVRLAWLAEYTRFDSLSGRRDYL